MKEVLKIIPKDIKKIKKDNVIDILLELKYKFDKYIIDLSNIELKEDKINDCEAHFGSNSVSDVYLAQKLSEFFDVKFYKGYNWRVQLEQFAGCYCVTGYESNLKILTHSFIFFRNYIKKRVHKKISENKDINIQEYSKNVIDKIFKKLYIDINNLYSDKDQAKLNKRKNNIIVSSTDKKSLNNSKTITRKTIKSKLKKKRKNKII
ncbi:MAG TPA: hypothetical protein ENG87_03610 [Candidatus Pacearchaeota archaeon]|nr:hypothetical protein [Candidatus Pacearchaeota archaeon]